MTTSSNDPGAIQVLPDVAPPVPEFVRVGPVRYRIVMDADEVRTASDEADLGADGTWAAFSDHRTNVIGIDPGSHPDQQRASVVHELLHCCLRVSGAWPDVHGQLVAKAKRNFDIGVEEFTVAAATFPLLSVLRDNPELLAWLCFDGAYRPSADGWAGAA